MVLKFTARDLAVCALFGALIFLEAFVLGSAVISATGISATGSLLNMFFGLLLISLGVKIVPRFGAATLIATIEGILTIPTVINGPPGVQKVLMMLMLGLFFDAALHISKRSKRGFVLGGAIGSAGIIFFIYLQLLILGLPGLAQLQPMLVPLMVANLVLGGSGAYTGVWLYEAKLKSRAFIRQWQS